MPGQLPGDVFPVQAMSETGITLPPALFVAGTDTGVGKTLVSACLLAFLIERGIAAGYQKWVSTGSSEESEDALLCRQAAPLAFGRQQNLHVPYRLGLAASPHLAAEQEGQQVDPERLLFSFSELKQKFETLVVEGVGGLMVPLNRQLLLVDLLRRLELPVILVCRSGLGSINHSLLSVEALRQRAIPVAGLVFSDEAAQLDERIVTDNMRTIAELGRVEIFGRLPRSSSLEEAVRSFQPIGQTLLASMQ